MSYVFPELIPKNIALPQRWKEAGPGYGKGELLTPLPQTKELCAGLGRLMKTHGGQDLMRWTESKE